MELRRDVYLHLEPERHEVARPRGSLPIPGLGAIAGRAYDLTLDRELEKFSGAGEIPAPEEERGTEIELS